MSGNGPTTPSARSTRPSSSLGYAGLPESDGHSVNASVDALQQGMGRKKSLAPAASPHTEALNNSMSYPNILSPSSSNLLGANQFPSNLSFMTAPYYPVMLKSSSQASIAVDEHGHPIPYPVSSPMNNGKPHKDVSVVVDPLLKSKEEEREARKVRDFFMFRYRSMGSIILILCAFFIAFLFPLLYVTNKKSYEHHTRMFERTTCTVTDREVEDIPFEDLCPTTVNHRFQIKVDFQSSVHGKVTGADGCSGSELTCYYGQTTDGPSCRFCEANRINSCHRYVSLDMDAYPQFQKDAEVPCWVYSPGGNQQMRVFLENPNHIMDYPEMSGIWILPVAFAVVLFILGMYMITRGRCCSRSKSHKKKKEPHVHKHYNSETYQEEGYVPPTIRVKEAGKDSTKVSAKNSEKLPE